MLTIRNQRSLLVDPQFWIAVVVGWFVCSVLWKNEDVSSTLRTLEDKCLPCVDKTCPNCDSDMKIQKHARNDFYRDYQWKPQHEDEDRNNYWRMTSQKHRYGMTNDEPRVGINGMWRLEREAVVDYFKNTFMNSEEEFAFVDLTLEQMLRKYDPFYGVSYIVKANTRQKNSAGNITVVPAEYRVRRKFQSGKPTLVDIKPVDNTEIVHVIMPLSKVTERFHKFMQKLEENVFSTDETVFVKLIFVIFGESKSEDSVRIVSVLDQFQHRNHEVNMLHKFVGGKFSRAIGLDTGVKMCPDDALMLFLDVDLSLTSSFLGRIRSNTVQHERVVFYIVFSQFDPDVTENYRTQQAKKESTDDQIGEDNGFWIYYAYGITSMYKSDYLSVGGFPLDIVGWGGEDVNIFKKFIASPTHDVMSTVDPDLVHIYHSRSCDVNLASDQYRMCIGALSETIGSKMQMGTLYLRQKENEYFVKHLP